MPRQNSCPPLSMERTRSPPDSGRGFRAGPRPVAAPQPQAPPQPQLPLEQPQAPELKLPLSRRGAATAVVGGSPAPQPAQSEAPSPPRLPPSMSERRGADPRVPRLQLPQPSVAQPCSPTTEGADEALANVPLSATSASSIPSSVPSCGMASSVLLRSVEAKESTAKDEEEDEVGSTVWEPPLPPSPSATLLKLQPRPPPTPRKTISGTVFPPALQLDRLQCAPPRVAHGGTPTGFTDMEECTTSSGASCSGGETSGSNSYTLEDGECGDPVPIQPRPTTPRHHTPAPMICDDTDAALEDPVPLQPPATPRRQDMQSAAGGDDEKAPMDTEPQEPLRTVRPALWQKPRRVRARPNHVENESMALGSLVAAVATATGGQAVPRLARGPGSALPSYRVASKSVLPSKKRRSSSSTSL